MLNAIIWDYDGTLVDTRRKNLEVTREIMRDILQDSMEDFKVLQSLEKYQKANDRSANWRDLYRTYFKLSDSQIDEASAMWKDYQINNETEVSLFDGIREVVATFSGYQHGIVSQNAYENISSYLHKQNLFSNFSNIIGYEEIGYDRQKPHPAGLLKCIRALGDFSQGSVIYIGDHETDIQCAILADKHYQESGSGLRVHSIAALYGLTSSTSNWEYKPSFEAYHPGDISSIIKKLDG